MDNIQYIDGDWESNHIWWILQYFFCFFFFSPHCSLPCIWVWCHLIFKQMCCIYRIVPYTYILSFISVSVSISRNYSSEIWRSNINVNTQLVQLRKVFDLDEIQTHAYVQCILCQLSYEVMLSGVQAFQIRINSIFFKNWQPGLSMLKILK